MLKEVVSVNEVKRELEKLRDASLIRRDIAAAVLGRDFEALYRLYLELGQVYRLVEAANKLKWESLGPEEIYQFEHLFDEKLDDMEYKYLCGLWENFENLKSWLMVCGEKV